MRKGNHSAGGLLLALSLLMSVSTVSANGFYGGFAFGNAKADIDTGAIDRELGNAGFPASTGADDSDTGFKLHAGYRFGDYLAVEGGYVEFGDFTTASDIGGGNPGRIESTLSIDGFFLTGVGGYPVSADFFVYGKAGVIFWDASATSRAELASGSGSAGTSDDGTDLTYGIGASYRIGEGVSVRLDWDHYDISGDTDTDVDLVSVGLQIGF